jgi:hypothetical protein
MKAFPAQGINPYNDMRVLVRTRKYLGFSQFRPVFSFNIIVSTDKE